MSLITDLSDTVAELAIEAREEGFENEAVLLEIACEQSAGFSAALESLAVAASSEHSDLCDKALALLG